MIAYIFFRGIIQLYSLATVASFIQHRLLGVRKSGCDTAAAILCFGICCAICTYSTAQNTPIANTHADSLRNAQRLSAEGMALFTQGDLEAAKLRLEQSLVSGFVSPEREYDLGLIYSRLGQPTLALLHFERSLKYAPYDAQTRQNILAIRTTLPDAIEPLTATWVVRGWRWVRSRFRADGWAMCGLLLWYGFAGGIAVWMLGTTRLQKQRGFWWGVGLLVVSALPFVFATQQEQAQTQAEYAIILVAEVQLRTAPDEESSDILTLHEGTKVHLLDRISDWYKVELANGEQGWLPPASIVEI